MPLRIRFRFDGKCSFHPRYNPARDGRPEHSKCEGCESLYVIYMYVGIARRRAENTSGFVASFSSTVRKRSTSGRSTNSKNESD